MFAGKFVRRATLTVLALGAMLVSVTSGLASSVDVVEINDDCDPATFNAAIGPGTCVGNGQTTFAQFIAELTKDKTVGDWEFDPDKLKLDAGRKLVAINRGGETHTFTEVAAFGGGFIDLLNQLSGNPVPAPECLKPPSATNIFVPAGGSTPELTLATGRHLFECCIHPWMRTTVTVESNS